jgi:hypothetical protein
VIAGGAISDQFRGKQPSSRLICQGAALQNIVEQSGMRCFAPDRRSPTGGWGRRGSGTSRRAEVLRLLALMPTLPILGAGRGSSGYKKEPRRGPTSGGAQPNRGLSVAELPPMGRLANRSVSAEFRAKRKRSGPGSRIIVPTPNRPAGSYIPAIMSKRKNVQLGEFPAFVAARMRWSVSSRRPTARPLFKKRLSFIRSQTPRSSGG